MSLGRLQRYLKRATADATTSAWLRDVVGHKSDTARSVVGTTRSLMSYLKGLVGNVPQLVAGTTDTSPLASMDLWTTDGMVMIHEIFGVVGTVIQSQATTITLSFDPDDGGSDVALCASGLDATGDATGTIYRLTKDFSEDLIALLDAFEVTDIQAPGIILGQAGDIKVTYGAASTGVINWYCLYTSLGGILAAG